MERHTSRRDQANLKLLQNVKMMQSATTTPIAKYPTPTAPQTEIPSSLFTGRSLITANATLISYATKGGLIRCIDKTTGGKTLLRLHGAGDVEAADNFEGLGRNSLHDISFFPGDKGNNGVIASVGNGMLFIWKIAGAVSPTGTTVTQQPLIQFLPLPPTSRLTWHPSNPNAFLLNLATPPDSATVEGSLFLIDTTILRTTRPEDAGAAPGTHACVKIEDGVVPNAKARFPSLTGEGVLQENTDFGFLGQSVVYAGGNHLRVASCSNGGGDIKVSKKFDSKWGDVSRVLSLNDGKYLAVGFRLNRTVRIFEVGSNQESVELVETVAIETEAGGEVRGCFFLLEFSGRWRSLSLAFTRWY
mgnify:CR=1 FL=1